MRAGACGGVSHGRIHPAPVAAAAPALSGYYDAGQQEMTRRRELQNGGVRQIRNTVQVAYCLEMEFAPTSSREFYNLEHGTAYRLGTIYHAKTFP